MINVQNFNLSVLKSHKAFFHLDKIDKNLSEVDVWIQKPDGLESVDFVDVFSMNDGSLIAAWKHPFQKLPLHNVVVFGNGKTQIVNLRPFERIVEIYNRPVDAEFGTFAFVNSEPIQAYDGDWRCDLGYYGPRSFGEMVTVFNELSEIVFYEPVFSINGVGQIIYMESRTKTDMADHHLNHAVMPCAGKTLQETLRLVWEWSRVANEPFDSIEPIAVSASKFIDGLGLSNAELESIVDQTPMQVENFIRQVPNARLRPLGIMPMTVGMQSLVKNHVAHSCLSSIVKDNPEMFNFQTLLDAENEELNAGIERFCGYYGVNSYETYTPTDAYAANQMSFFKNKSLVLGSLA